MGRWKKPVGIQLKETPCKDCAERCAECHGKCEKYAEYRKKIDDIRQAYGKRRVGI